METPSKQYQPLFHMDYSNAPKKANTRKNVETSCIALWKPDLNEQKDFERLVLFKNGVT